LASADLDKSWDDWMKVLSGCYVVITDRMDEKKIGEAAQEYKIGFSPTIKKMYTELSSTAPARFVKINSEDWGDWIRQFYIKTSKTGTALTESNADEANKGLAGLREWVYTLHEKAGLKKSNDVIFAFNKMAASEKPADAELVKLAAELDKAGPSLDAKAKADAFAKAKAEWKTVADPILKDGKVAPAELAPLRKASEKFYKAFGVQFE